MYEPYRLRLNYCNIYMFLSVPKNKLYLTKVSKTGEIYCFSLKTEFRFSFPKNCIAMCLKCSNLIQKQVP